MLSSSGRGAQGREGRLWGGQAWIKSLPLPLPLPDSRLVQVTQLLRRLHLQNGDVCNNNTSTIGLFGG